MPGLSYEQEQSEAVRRSVARLQQQQAQKPLSFEELAEFAKNNAPCAAPPGKGGVLYSGMGDQNIVTTFAGSRDMAVIDDTARANLLLHPAFIRALLKSQGVDVDSDEQAHYTVMNARRLPDSDPRKAAALKSAELLFGKGPDANTTEEQASEALQKSLFGRASSEFAGSIDGDIIFLLGFEAKKVAWACEIPVLAAKGGSRTINGIPCSSLGPDRDAAFAKVVGPALAAGEQAKVEFAQKAAPNAVTPPPASPPASTATAGSGSGGGGSSAGATSSGGSSAPSSSSPSSLSLSGGGGSGGGGGGGGRMAARVFDPVAHPLPPVLQPGPGSFNVIIGGRPAWRGVGGAAAAAIQAARQVSDATIQVAEAATLAAAGTPGAPAAKVAEEATKATAAASMGSMISAAAGMADIHICMTPLPLPPHGPGVVIDGSQTVLVNGLPLCRQGDTIIEAVGPPNKITMGQFNVLVGG